MQTMKRIFLKPFWRIPDRRYHRLIVLLVALSLGVAIICGGFGQSRALAEEGACLGCHQATWDRDLGRFYVHAPFMEKKCGHCHVAASFKEPQASVPVPPSAIDWFRRNRVPASDHWFAFSPSLVADHLWIETREGKKSQNPYYVSLPPLESLPEFANDGGPPQIGRVEVQEISLGVFVSARITWKTDEFADSSLRFGLGKLTEESTRDFNLRQNHEVILSGLERGKEYLFSVVSEDVFGNRAVSAPMAFSTHRNLPSNESDAKTSSPSMLNSTELSLIHRLHRAGDQYLLLVEAPQPVTVSLGKNAVAAKGPNRLAQAPLNSGDPTHPPLQDEVFLNISVCLNCHQNISQAMSHPINILPPRGMLIPPEYPLLADGRMTCMSCHLRHGSDLPFRMIKSSRKELCIGCHVNY